jgi:hypothetical protein
MQVQPAAGVLGEGFGHEGGRQAVFLGRGLDCALQQQRVVAGQHRIVYVVQVHFELARGILCQGSARGNFLDVAETVQVDQERFHVVQVVKAGKLDAHLLPVRTGDLGHTGNKGISVVTYQVKLQFGRHHRVQTQFLQGGQ